MATELATYTKRLESLQHSEFEVFIQQLSNATSPQEIDQMKVAYEKHFRTNLAEAARLAQQDIAAAPHPPPLYQLIPRKRDKSDVHLPANQLTVL